jgi:competence protein ComFB
MEDIVKSETDKICASIEGGEAAGGICTCPQCRLDAACYVLNRVQPRYFISNRGLVREEQNTLDRQQLAADVTTLVLKALKMVGHNRRAGVHEKEGAAKKGSEKPVFNLPAITGRLFDGRNFEPMRDIQAELYFEGALVPMKNANWQNPCLLSPQTEGAYAFWPQSMAAAEAGEHGSFEFLLCAEAQGLDPFKLRLKIPVISERVSHDSPSESRTFRVNDVYMFPPEPEREE